ncbi:MAG TPA: LacI family DNA-binding transcriptional regulator [Candidatus Caccousia avistercoris]|nr:LacI family DNA-binding transcriptional regulator [Candidatus Caccousia avistercoris]
MASLYDVAKRAGVSKTLVSRVIGNKSGVSEKSRARILAAMEELNYTPNALAQSLVLKKTNTIGVVLDSLSDPFFSELINGIEHEVAKTEYNVIFCSGHDHMNLKNRYITYMMQGRVDGIIIFGSYYDDEELIRQIEQSRFPAVVAENDLAGTGIAINNIVVDNEYGSQLAVDYLFSRGCRSIYHLVGETRVKAAMDRLKGYRKAMAAHGVQVDGSMLLDGGFDVQPGYQAMAQWLEEHGPQALPDAFYCGADKAAFGAMMALEDAGIPVPERVMLVGFDDDKPLSVDRPLKKLTTLSQPLYQIGVTAVKLLLGEMENRGGAKQRLVFSPKLIIRDTTRN